MLTTQLHFSRNIHSLATLLQYLIQCFCSWSLPCTVCLKKEIKKREVGITRRAFYQPQQTQKLAASFRIKKKKKTRPKIENFSSHTPAHLKPSERSRAPAEKKVVSFKNTKTQNNASSPLLSEPVGIFWRNVLKETAEDKTQPAQWSSEWPFIAENLKNLWSQLAEGELWKTTATVVPCCWKYIHLLTLGRRFVQIEAGPRWQREMRPGVLVLLPQ